MKKYSLDGQGNHYYIETTRKDKEIGRMFIDISH